MRSILYCIFLASATMMLNACGSSEKKSSEKKGNDSITSAIINEDITYTELSTMPLPCSKEKLYTAWKQIGVIEAIRKKNLDYKQHTPVFFISTDLDKDGNCEVLLRGEPPYAAVFSYVKDSLHLITFADKAETGLGITPDGVIMRSANERDGSIVSQFIRLKGSKIDVTGATREMFAIKDGAMISSGMKYMLQNDTAMVEVSKEEYEQVAPQHQGTFLEDIDGWEDFRKP